MDGQFCKSLCHSLHLSEKKKLTEGFGKRISRLGGDAAEVVDFQDFSQVGLENQAFEVTVL